MTRSLATLLTAAVLFTSALTGCGEEGVPLETAASVDLEAYSGTWYEIARLPNTFEKNCTGVTATYTPRDDGWVDVENKCYKDSLDGKLKVANGVARVLDETTNAKLEVSFFRPFFGNYQIMMVDEGDYSLVGEPKREFLWLLSRTPTMTPEVEEMLLKRAEDEGFDISQLEWTLQVELAE